MKILHNISRVEAFSDAVFAFAATLLVVSVGNDNSASILKIDWVIFISFAISFFVLVLLWWTHYNFFRRANYMNNWIILLNSILLFVVLYYIFPLKSLINSATGNVSMTMNQFSSLFQLYSLGFFLIFSCYSGMYFIAYKRTKSESKNIDLFYYSRHFLIYVIVAFLSILISIFHLGLKIGLPGIIYTLLGPLCYFHGVHFRKKFKN